MLVFLLAFGVLALLLVRRRCQSRSARFLAEGEADQVGHANRDLAHGRIRILSHNLWLHYLVAAPHRTQRIAAFLDRLRQRSYDVVVIEEAFLFRIGPVVLSGYLEALTNGMSALGYHHWTNPYASLPSCFGQNSGVIIYSRYPFTTPPLSKVFAQPERLNNKGIVAITIQTRARINRAPRLLTLVGTHLSSTDSQAKVTQVREIRAVAEHALSTPDSMVVITGDFNICPRTCFKPVDPADYGFLRNEFNRFVNVFEERSDVQAPRFISFRQKPSESVLFLSSLSPKPLSIWTSSSQTPSTPLTTESLDHMFYGTHDKSIVFQPVAFDTVDWFIMHGGCYLPVSDHLGISCEFEY